MRIKRQIDVVADPKLLIIRAEGNIIPNLSGKPIQPLQLAYYIADREWMTRAGYGV
tara:strand:- start:405 stop:572 length:168 start_codon:yes stop_codon:yes gene_type:complete